MLSARCWWSLAVCHAHQQRPRLLELLTKALPHLYFSLPRLANSLKVGGRVYFMKGPGVADELKVFHPEDFGYKLIAKHFYTIPNSTQDRALVILERVE